MTISSVREDSRTVSVVQELASRMLKQDVVRAEKIGKGANSRVFRLEDETGKQYVAKFYFRHPTDARDRLNVEYSGLSFLLAEGITNIPRPVVMDREESCAIYEFIEGRNIAGEDITVEDVDCAVEFLSKLKKLKESPKSHDIQLASEACLSPQAIVENILQRLNRLYKLQETGEEYAELKSFLMNAIKPLLNILREWAHRRGNQLHIPFDKDIPLGQRTLSPSDFGFHNAIREKNGRIVFLDFEYFGWDDPAKMVADFLLHPAMSLSGQMKRTFFDQIVAAFAENDQLAKRVEVVYPLYGIKWCLIFLNEFIPGEFSRRVYATGNESNKTEIRKEQLAKARTIYRDIKETYQAFPYKK